MYTWVSSLPALGILLFVVDSSWAQTSGAPGSLKAAFNDLSVQSSLLTGGDQPVESREQVSTFATLLGLEVATAPVGTSTGGFTFTFDDQVQSWRRSSESFGPAFAERSLTAGRGKVSAGVNWVHASYGSLNGDDLADGSFRPSINSKQITLAGLPVGDAVLKMKIASDTVVGYASVGVTNDLDVGIAVPWVRVSVDADLGLFDLAGRDLTTLALGRHIVVPPQSAAGIGDVSMFAKYRLWRDGEGGLAGEVTVFVPSGDADNMRGTGVTRTLFSAIWSKGGRLSPHANAGYEVWSSRVDLAASRDVYAKNQFKYAAGVEFQAHGRVTALLDVVGRRLLKGGTLDYVTVVGPGGRGTFDTLVGVSKSLDVISLAPGIKWNVWRQVIVTGNLLTTLTNQGLRADVIPAFGLDWAF